MPNFPKLKSKSLSSILSSFDKVYSELQQFVTESEEKVKNLIQAKESIESSIQTASTEIEKAKAVSEKVKEFTSV